MEIDTTELFNSPFKPTTPAARSWSLFRFIPNSITYADSTVLLHGGWPWCQQELQHVLWNSYSFVYAGQWLCGLQPVALLPAQSHLTTNINFGSGDRVFRFQRCPGTWSIGTVTPSSHIITTAGSTSTSSFEQMELYGLRHTCDMQIYVI